MSSRYVVFDEHAGRYDRWFSENPGTYHQQLHALRQAVGFRGRGLEVGVGSGRFAAPLGLQHGIDPSPNMTGMASKRGIEVVLGIGESLPYRPGVFGCVLMMTVICYLKDVLRVFREVNRILEPDGKLVVGFIERGGLIAETYLKEPEKGTFLRYATFRTLEEVTSDLEGTGFSRVEVPWRKNGFCIVSATKV
jgi:SAM-dependent methyltransferase